MTSVIPPSSSQPFPGGYSSIPLLDLEQSHHDQETVSPISSRERFYSSDIYKGDASDVSRLSTEPHDTSGQCMNEQNEPTSPTPSEFRKGTKHSSHYWRDYIHKFWFWEFAACALSFACFSAIIAVLLCERDKPLDEWKLFISPPATVSFLGTLAKASLVLVLSQVLSQMKWLHFQDVQPLDQLKALDSASHGPLGSITVLRDSKKVLISIAACLMILTILLDPFVQLVFTFPTKLVTDPGQSAIFNRVDLFDGFGDIVGPGYSVNLWFALNRGLMNATIIQVECPTGNCSWSEPIHTLGICGSCSKENVTKTCSPMVLETPHDDPIDCGVDPSDCINHTTCFYTFNDVILSTEHDSDEPLVITTHTYQSSWFSVDSQWGTLWNATSYASNTRVDKNPPIFMNDSFNAMIDLYEYDAAGVRGPEPATLYYSGNGGILEFAAVQRPLNVSSHSDHPPARCWTCRLNWCEKIFEKILVVNNQLMVTVSEKPLWSFSVAKDGGSIDTQYEVLPEDVDLRTNITRSLRTRYETDSSPLLPLLDVFDSYYGLGSMVLPSFQTDLARNPGMLASLVDVEDLNISINRIAESLSEMSRSFGSEKVRGDAQVSKSFIKVRWEWLILPIAVLVMSFVLLMIVARRSYKAGVSIWKDDPIVLLFHHIAGLEINPGDKDITEPSDLAELTKDVYVKLSSDEALTFVKCAEKVKQQ